MLRHPFQASSSHAHQRQNSSTKKQYSYSQMKRWCQQLLSTHSSQLLNQINENNEVIKILSEKVKFLQLQLSKKEQIISLNQMSSYNKSPIDTDQVITIMNNLLNSKLKDIQEDVNIKLNSLESMKQHLFKLHSKREVENYQNRMESEINSKISNIKVFVKERLQHTVNNNTQYWGKIKQWLKKIEGRYSECLSKGDGVTKSMEVVEDEISKGLLNLYKMRNFNTRVKQVELAVYDLEQSFKNITQYQGEYKLLVEKSAAKQTSQIDIPQMRYKSSSPRFNEYQLKYNKQKAKSKPKLNIKYEKLSPLENNFSNMEQNLVFGHNSFYSDSTARKQKKQTITKSIEQRLIALTREKSLSTPVSCFRDQFGYLKNSLNNYIFDLEGNMFKLSLEEFDYLSSSGINLLKRI